MIALQLSPPIPVFIPSRQSAGFAHVMLDYGPEYDTLWVVVLANGEWWTLRQAELRGQENQTFGRPKAADKTLEEWRTPP
jgi:hypothetical protein